MTVAKEAAKKIEAVAADATKAVGEQINAVSKAFDDAAAFGQGNVKAMVEATNVAAKATEQFNAEVIAFTKKSIEDANAAFKSLASVKTVTEFVELQTQLSKTHFDVLTKQNQKFAEMAQAALKDVLAPLNARVSAAAELAKVARG